VKYGAEAPGNSRATTTQIRRLCASNHRPGNRKELHPLATRLSDLPATFGKGTDSELNPIRCGSSSNVGITSFLSRNRRRGTRIPTPEIRASGMCEPTLLSAWTYYGLSVLWVAVAKPHFTRKVSRPIDQCSTRRAGARQGRVQWRVSQLGWHDMRCEKTPSSTTWTLHSKDESRARRVG